MKIDKKLIKELVDNLKEFNLTELEYQDGDKKSKFQEHQESLLNKLKLAQLFQAINQFLLTKVMKMG